MVQNIPYLVRFRLVEEKLVLNLVVIQLVLLCLHLVTLYCPHFQVTHKSLHLLPSESSLHHLDAISLEMPHIDRVKRSTPELIKLDYLDIKLKANIKSCYLGFLLLIAIDAL